MWYFATCLKQDMDEAEEQLPDDAKKERRIMARQQVFDRYMSAGDMPLTETTTPTKGRFADPALLVSKRR